MIKQVKPCPSCGELAGWIEKWAVTYGQIYTSEGQADEITEYVWIEGLAGGKRKTCARCHYPITSLVKEPTHAK